MRAMQARERFMTREQVAEAWFEEEYDPVAQMLREVGLCTETSETDAYMAVVTLRYLLLRTHRWDETVLEALREQMKQRTQMRRNGRPEDIAAAVMFFASPAASWVTGKLLEVDGAASPDLVPMPIPDL